MGTKFKVGDKVKVVKANASFLAEYVGNIYTISKINPNSCNEKEHYEVKEPICSWLFEVDELELAPFTKADLKPGMVVEYRNGDKALYVNDYFMEQRTFMQIGRFYNDLTFTGAVSSDRDYDICKVYTSKATTFATMFDDKYLELVWERKEEVKEMTVAEIEKKLGYKVKIVDGE